MLIAPERIPALGETYVCWRLPYGGKDYMAGLAEGNQISSAHTTFCTEAEARLLEKQIVQNEAQIVARRFALRPFLPRRSDLLPAQHHPESRCTLADPLVIGHEADLAADRQSLDLPFPAALA
jgi:hypothetical protein